MSKNDGKVDIGAKEERISRKEWIVDELIIDGSGGTIVIMLQNKVTNKEKQEKSQKTGIVQSVEDGLLSWFGFEWSTLCWMCSIISISDE